MCFLYLYFFFFGVPPFLALHFVDLSLIDFSW